MKIELKDFIDFVETKHKCDISILIHWDKETNMIYLQTQGSNREFADTAAKTGSAIYESITGIKITPEMVNEDLRNRHDNPTTT